MTMSKLPATLSIIVATLALGAAVPLHAQQKRVSPHETISANIEGNRVTVIYGRPYSKDPKTGEPRKIWGGLVPAGRVWRLGADEATLLITQQPLAFGETTIPAGAHTLFLLPEEGGGAKLIVSKQIGQWGTQYDDKQDVARIDLKKEAAEKPVDQFTITLEKNAAGGGTLKLAWEDTQYSAPFTVKK